MPKFIQGLELSRRFYLEAVRPLLDRHFPGLPHAAARIGQGSEVLGFDTEMSMDHNWYPHVQVFLRDVDEALEKPIKEMLSRNLPHVFLDFPVDTAPVPEEPGTYVMSPLSDGPVNHQIIPRTLRAYIRGHMAWDLDDPLEVADWLTFPSQVLREMTDGVVYYDGVGELTALRQKLAWYPHDVWLYLLASGWQRIDQEQPLMGRAGYVGDELGSGLIGSRLVRDIMTLCFLMEKQYAPYPKWFGTAFKQLRCAGEMTPLLRRAELAKNWQEREITLGEASENLARMHNNLEITDPLPEKLTFFYDRPFKVIRGSAFANAILERITDPEVQRIASHGLIGNIDQFSDSTDLRSDDRWRLVLRRLYDIDESQS